MASNSPSSASTIRAAGGVLWREIDSGPEFAIVHRPRYDDWSLPKGKVKRHETHLAAALREVTEETGSQVALSRRVGRIGYQIDGLPKTVDYWAMRHVLGEFVASEEVDELRWCDPASARALLSYDHDAKVLDTVVGGGVPTSSVALVRHAKAGKRSDWRGDDRLRPLDRGGREQAARLAGFLAQFAPVRILAAHPVRCLQTVEPLANEVRLPIETADQFADSHFHADPNAAIDALRELAVREQSVVISSQGDTIPALVDDLMRDDPPKSTATRKAAVWVLSFRLGRVVSADYYSRAPNELTGKTEIPAPPASAG